MFVRNNCVILCCVLIGVCGKKVKDRDLIIVFDTTSSMSDDIVQMRQNAEQVVKSFAAKKPNPVSNYILIEFKDNNVFPTKKSLDHNEFLLFLQPLTAKSEPYIGGPWCPEQCYAGIEIGLDSSNPDSFLFVFTDAYTKQPEKKKRILELISKKRTKIFFFIADDSCLSNKDEVREYESLATASVGLYFNTSDRSTIGQVILRNLVFTLYTSQ